jgi:seryl-tRNA synthetase
MLDIKLIRKDPEKVKEGIKKKGFDANLVDEILKLDKEKREILKVIESLRAQINKLSKVIGKEKDSEKKGQYLKESKETSTKLEILEKDLKEKDKNIQRLMSQLPNLPFDDVPFGKDESDNVVVKIVGKIPKFDFQIKDYLEIGESLDLIDVKRAAKVSGTRFGYLKREMVLLEFALFKFALDTLTKENFIPILPPVLIKEEMAWGMGYIEQLDREEAYYLEKDKLYLVGTSEQSIGPYFANEILKEKDLPIRFVSFSTCFRREAGSYGKDTRGIFRVHQFDKLEMFSFCHPEKSREEHEFFLSLEEKLMKALRIPYRVLKICTGDLGRPAAAKYDIEAWFPYQNRYRETHSTSNCTDFQARRLNIRYFDTKKNKLDFVHTVNGTAFSQRPLLAILENFQQKDGSVKIPKVLHKYLPFKEIKRHKN